MSHVPKLKIEHKQSSVSSWEYDEVTDVSSGGSSRLQDTRVVAGVVIDYDDDYDDEGNGVITTKHRDHRETKPVDILTSAPSPNTNSAPPAATTTPLSTTIALSVTSTTPLTTIAVPVTTTTPPFTTTTAPVATTEEYQSIAQTGILCQGAAGVTQGNMEQEKVADPDEKQINEDVEGEEVQELDNENERNDADEDNEGDTDAVNTAPSGSMTSTGPGGHRLDTLDGAAAGHRALPMTMGSGAPGQDDDDDDEEDDDDDVQAPVPEGAYDPAEYDNLNVSPEVRELFTYITRYTPQAIELEHRLRPYIPDYIPAVGDIDAFIKILPPDGSETKVGLTVLDEPSARQSDATVLDLQLRALARHTTAKTVAVKTVESAEKNPKVVEKWVRDISDLHRARPPPTVHYTKRMPDIDSLMQEWPGELEEMLHDIRLPNAALDLDLDNYAGLICAIMDIPVYKSKIQSLHVLFTLYSEFRNSVHFRRLAENNYMDNDDEAAERLVID